MVLRDIYRHIQGRLAPRCPDCDELIASDAMNIQEGVALCANCGTLSRLSELNLSGKSIDEILSSPPQGCSIEPRGPGVVITASLRSIGGFVGCAAFALFWNGIVSVFVLLAIAGLYTNLIGPLPTWFPAPGMNDGKPEMNGDRMDLGMSLFLCVFLTPFILVGTGMVAAAIINLVGKIEVVIDEFESSVTTGIPIFRWKRRFDARQIRAVSYGTTNWESNGRRQRTIELVADRTVKFGSMLQFNRMEWLRAVLYHLLLRGDGKSSRTDLPDLSWIGQKR